MSPNIHFALSHDGYDRFSELLAPHDITVTDKSREIVEKLPSGAISTHSHAGVLHFRGHDFNYRRRKSPGVGYVEITHTEADPATLEALLNCVQQVFPQPKRTPPPPAHLTPWYRQIGCAIMLLIFGALSFFLVLGIRAFLQWL